MERIYPSYKGKIERNDKQARDNPSAFAESLNTEYRKARKSKSKVMQRLDKLPVRIYGSGDYIFEHYEFMKDLDFKFYIISKSLTEKHRHSHISKLLKLDLLTTICLSFDLGNLSNYYNLKQLFGTDRLKFTFTGSADEFNALKKTGHNFDIFFNTSNKKVEKEKSRLIKEQCPCDSGAMEHVKSCSKCNKCWRSSITKGKEWNI